MTYDMGNVGPGLGKLQKCAKIKWAYDILTLPVLIIEFEINHGSQNVL
jgi:hypothetical protein